MEPGKGAQINLGPVLEQLETQRLAQTAELQKLEEEISQMREAIGQAESLIKSQMSEQEGKGNGHYGLLESIPYKKAGIPQAEAYEKAGFAADARDFRPAAKILQDLGVGSIQMITNNPKKTRTLTQYGIRISGTVGTE